MKTAILLLLLAAGQLFAVPQLVNYQGSLTATDGSPIDSTLSMTIRLYDAATNGTVLWTEVHPTVQVSSGLFHVMLGSLTPLGDLFASPRWIGISIGEDGEMTPREQIVTVAHAYRVGTVDGASGGTITGFVKVTEKVSVGSLHSVGGSNSLVVGLGNGTTASNTFSSGTGNSVQGANGSITGGSDNSLSGLSSTIGGGEENHLDADYASIVGGQVNEVYGSHGIVGGGTANYVEGSHAAILGGYSNDATANYTSVVGGYSNEATGTGSSVGGEALIAHEEDIAQLQEGVVRQQQIQIMRLRHSRQLEAEQRTHLMVIRPWLAADAKIRHMVYTAP